VRRRITIAILGTVAAALMLAGLGTLALTRVTAQSTARRELVSQAEATSALLELGNGLRTSTGARIPARDRLVRVREALKLDDVDVVLLDSQNQPMADGDPLPPSVRLRDTQLGTLRQGEIVSGNSGQGVWAVAPLSTRGDVQPILVLRRNLGLLPGTGIGWFLVSSAGVLVLGALVAARLSRRLTKPLSEARLATERIAQGDLGVRVPTQGTGTRDELDDLAHAINHMADSLARSRGLEQQFLLSVSHDLRTPLTSIQGYAEAIADGAAPDDRAAAGIILAESRRLGRLVRDLLELGKLEARQFTFAPTAVDLVELVGDSVDGFRREVGAAGLRIDLDRPPGPVWAKADPDRLAQVLANLVENALKHAAAAIVVSVAMTAGHPEITVADDGPGIAPEDLPHVFERLYVAGHAPVRKEIGSGLGLAIARELVEAMSGSVRAEAGPAGGARLIVTLPLTPPTRPPAPYVNPGERSAVDP
jgi:signal transduction histidine kinase